MSDTVGYVLGLIVGGIIVVLLVRAVHRKKG